MPGDIRPTATHSSPDDPDPAAPDVDFGDRGCGEGLGQDLRRHITAVGVGESVRFAMRDPSAKADIPSLARMLGHRVLSEEPLADGRLVITVERGK